MEERRGVRSRSKERRGVRSRSKERGGVSGGEEGSEE